MSNRKARVNYRWSGGCCSFDGFAALSLDEEAPESDEESVVDSESDAESDDEEEEDDDDDEEEYEEDEAVESERFLFLSTARNLEIVNVRKVLQRRT